MVEFQEFIKQYTRMCETYKNTCDGCILQKHKGILSCWRWCFENPAKAEEMVMQWAKEHPPITNRAKFAEVFGCDPVLLDFWNQRGGDWLLEEYKEPKDGRSNEN